MNTTIEIDSRDVNALQALLARERASAPPEEARPAPRRKPADAAEASLWRRYCHARWGRELSFDPHDLDFAVQREQLELDEAKEAKAEQERDAADAQARADAARPMADWHAGLAKVEAEAEEIDFKVTRLEQELNAARGEQRHTHARLERVREGFAGRQAAERKVQAERRRRHEEAELSAMAFAVKKQVDVSHADATEILRAALPIAGASKAVVAAVAYVRAGGRIPVDVGARAFLDAAE